MDEKQWIMVRSTSKPLNEASSWHLDGAVRKGVLMHPSPFTATTSATPTVGKLPPILPLKLSVVSTKPGLGQSVQVRLDEMTPHLYHVTQVETLADLEAVLHLCAVQRYPWVACFIDMAFPPLLNQSSDFYVWLMFSDDYYCRRMRITQ